ncbi:uncharacterized protein RHOBADRAFT_54710 [Rhodotorula graminis WP1]|uniref:Cytidyltransferase-like domain-containing protein n=1 Tax=Rhodotorula graminis (strain WP1) TaxID=578459 RepID=A0A0P9EJ17_RHOGW|nr:uncharacterized protein RHOBADRAFT_54710 [Rhodotorula graminis WP1]KPV73491.1 hypothetical protein RHOBADRAFT_54710 [Rhodotorula graminis WP1]
MAQPDHTVVLSFPSLSHLVNSSSSARSASHLDWVHSAAQQTNTALLVIIRTPRDAPSPWSPAPSSTSTTTSPTSPPPTALFLPLEQALARIYNAATHAFLDHDDGHGPLKHVDVVVEQMRDPVSRLCVSDDSATSHWDYSRDGVDGDDDGMGKGKATAAPGPDSSAATSTPTTADSNFPPTYPVVALGGTFDHLHAGHKILLTMAASLCTSRLVVGVSDDHLLVNKKFKHLLEPIDVRMRAVRRFVELVRPSVECDAVPLQDVYGPTANDPAIEALVVSDETRAGGDAINTLRASRSLSRLDIFTISLVGGEEAQRQGRGAGAGAEVEVEVATKMGSTGIREWLDRRERERAQREAEAEGERGGAAGEAVP